MLERNGGPGGGGIGEEGRGGFKRNSYALTRVGGSQVFMLSWGFPNSHRGCVYSFGWGESSLTNISEGEGTLVCLGGQGTPPG